MTKGQALLVHRKGRKEGRRGRTAERVTERGLHDEKEEREERSQEEQDEFEERRQEARSTSS